MRASTWALFRAGIIASGLLGVTIAAAGGALIRRFENGGRWTALAAAGAVLLAWTLIILIAVVGDASVVAPLAVTGASATLLTAGSAQVLIRRQDRLANADRS